MERFDVRVGDCRRLLAAIADGSIDSIVTDPPYPEIDRDYGRLSEAEWWDLMVGVVGEAKRVLTPAGSAVFVLQPNSERIGSMRAWAFEFMAYIAREWNMPQDAYWWNPSAMPTTHCQRRFGLMRPSVKLCVWAGPADCYRNQDAVLTPLKDAARARLERGRGQFARSASGHRVDRSRILDTVIERGGATPMNIIRAANTNSSSSGGAHGHGAATPAVVASWWIRYLTPPGGVTLDPFCGSGTHGVEALRNGFRFIGFEQHRRYAAVARKRILAA